VGVIAACFVAEMGLLGGGDGEEVMEGVVVPRIRDGNALFIAISLLGAVVMPHNLFLHSALVLSRRFRMGEKPLRTALKYNVLESACALAVTLVINFAVVIVAAQTIDDPSISDERRQEIIDRPLQNAPDMLKHALGSSAKILFAVALLASGQSSTITGTYAGQFVMEGFLELKINPVLRAFLTRIAAIIPSLLVCIIAGDEHAETLIVVSSVILFFQLPFALIPLVKFCAAENVMGAMRISNRLAIFTRVLAFVIVLANMTLVVQSIHASGLVNASVGGVFLGVFVALSSLAYCASLLALSLRPVMQNLTPMVAKRLQATETLEYESEYEARGDGGGKGLLEDLEY
jgi:manganese transport protein